MKREKVDNGKETGMIHSWRCCQGKSYINVHAVSIFSAIKYMFLWILKDPFERLLAVPCKHNQLKAPSTFGPFLMSSDIWIGVFVSPRIHWYLLCFCFMNGSHQLQIPGEGLRNSLSLYTTCLSLFISLSAHWWWFSHHENQENQRTPQFSLICVRDCLRLHPSLPFVVLRAHWTHSLQGRIQPSHATYILTSPVWTKTHHFNGSYCLCLWVIRCLLREKEPLQRSQTECANQSPGSCKPW